MAPIGKLWLSCIRFCKPRCIPGKLGRRVRFKEWHSIDARVTCGGILWGQRMLDNCTLEVHADDGEVSVGSHESMASQ